jgi:hypothetical protein
MKIPSLVFFFLILFSAHEVLALSCKQYSLEEAFNKSDAVFVGRAKTVETLSAAPPKDMGLLGYLSHKVIFDIERSWKGVKQNHLAIYVRSFPDLLGEHF